MVQFELIAMPCWDKFSATSGALTSSIICCPSFMVISNRLATAGGDVAAPTEAMVAPCRINLADCTSRASISLPSESRIML